MGPSLKSSATRLLALQLLLLLLLAVSTVSASDVSTASDTVESIFDSAKGVKVGAKYVAIISIAAGLFICFAGYKLIHATLFVVGFVAGGLALALTAENVFELETWVVTASWVAFVVGGLLVGLIATTLVSTAIFLAGAVAGVLLAILINTSVGYKIYPSNPDVVLLVLAIILGVICGVLAVKLEKPVLILITSLVGAWLLVGGFGYFAGDFPSPSDIKKYANEDTEGDWDYDIPSAWWMYLLAIVVLCIVGMGVQFKNTARRTYYTRSHPSPPPLREQQAQIQWGVPMTRQQQQQQRMQPGGVRYGNPIYHV